MFGNKYGASNINIKKKFEEALHNLNSNNEISVTLLDSRNNYNVNFANLYNYETVISLPINVINIFKDTTLGMYDTSKINLFKAYLILLDNMTTTLEGFNTISEPVGILSSIVLSKKIGITSITYKKYLNYLQQLNLLYINDTPIYFNDPITSKVKRFPNVYSYVDNKKTVDEVINQRQQYYKSSDKNTVSNNMRYTTILTWINRGKTDYDLNTLQSVYDYVKGYNAKKDKLIAETDQYILDKYPNKFKKMDISRLEKLLDDNKNQINKID